MIFLGKFTIFFFSQLVRAIGLDIRIADPSQILSQEKNVYLGRASKNI